MLFKKKKKASPFLLLVQGSLSPTSKTALLIQKASSMLASHDVRVEILDLRTANMDFCNGRPIEEYNESTQAAYTLMKKADGYIFGMPIYSHSVSGALKNLIDIGGSTLFRKPAGIVCHAQGVKGYLASMDLAKILSFEAQMNLLQPIVHTNEESFRKDEIFDDQVTLLLKEMIDVLLKKITRNS